MTAVESEADWSAGRTQAVMAAIRRRVAQRSLAPGDKLPSIRRLADDMGVSPSTVVEAYDRLAADGLVRSRPGAGFFVCGVAAPVPLAEIGPVLERAIDPLWVSRQSLDAGAGVSRPGCGWLPSEWMPDGLIRRALRAAARADGEILTDYGATRGAPALRHLLARQLAGEGLDVGAEQILLTTSGTRAVDLLCRFLLSPGDTVLVDDPCYFNFLALLRAHRVRVVGVPRTPAGPDVALFAEAVQRHRPRLYVTNAAIHNPTGASLSPQVAHRILSTAAAHDLTIVEDDIFADFEPEPSPRLAALDGLARVVRIGSFSKTLSSSVRCGYIVARTDWIDGLVDLQVASNFGGASPLAVDIVTRALSDSGYRKHMAGVRTRLAQRRRETLAALGRIGIVPWTVPRGGFFLWCRLPDGRDAAEVAKLALGEGVVLAPGNVFSVAQSAADCMRFNVTCTDPAVLRLLGRLLRG